MRARAYVAAAVRWLVHPKVAVAVGALLVAAALVTAAFDRPPSHAVLRPLAVGVVLVLRGLALPVVRRRLHHRLRRRVASSTRQPEAQR